MKYLFCKNWSNWIDITIYVDENSELWLLQMAINLKNNEKKFKHRSIGIVPVPKINNVIEEVLTHYLKTTPKV